jgi:uncharacterized protein
MELQELPILLAVCRLKPATPIPAWALNSTFFSITQTAEELSIVCDQTTIHADTKMERDWKIFKVAGTLDFSLTGILSSIAQPLAEQKISIFAISTFDTDFVLVKKEKWQNALQTLRSVGFVIKETP